MHYFTPLDHKTDGLVIMISDRQGWDDAATAMARHLIRDGEVVYGLDLQTYRAALAKDPNACTTVNSDLEVIARDVEKDLSFNEYRPPVILGLGAGSGIAYAAVGEVMPNTFAGGIGIRFDPVIDVGHRLCLPLAQSSAGDQGGPVRYGPVTDHETPFLFTPSQSFAAPDGGLDTFLSAMKQAHRISGDKDDIAAVDDAIRQIPRVGKGESSVDGLPLVEIQPAAG